MLSQLGQLIVTGVKGLVLSSDEKDFLQKNNIGGVILFAHNYESPAQLAELINEIQKLRDEHPLFISVDHEGGRVIRFKTHFTQFPSMFDLAKFSSPKLIYDVHAVMASELRAVGINLSYSPCCDVWTNPNNKVIGDRAFGTSVDVVDKFISAAIRGLQTNGVIACAKHFPGHGDTTKDSHHELPYIKKSLEELRSKEIIPFYKASKARVEMMMMAHLMVDAIDEEHPTSLSSNAYDLLRKEAKFSKLIITDDMEMKAVSEKYSLTEAATRALLAGADLILYRNIEDSKIVFEHLNQEHKKKKLPSEMLGEKYKKIQKLKETYLKEYKSVDITKLNLSFNTPESIALIENIKSMKTKIG